MKLPNGELAIIDIRKLTEYCLNPLHPDGQHKTIVFRLAAGLTLETTELLHNALRRVATDGEAAIAKVDRYGQPYVIDFDFQGPENVARVRSTWIIRTGETVPRLVTCYII